MSHSTSDMATNEKRGVWTKSQKLLIILYITTLIQDRHTTVRMAVWCQGYDDDDDFSHSEGMKQNHQVKTGQFGVK